MKRVFYISDDLDELELVEHELELSGFTAPQIHVLSNKDAEVSSHKHLHPVQSVMRNDVVHSTEIGAVIGVIAAAGILIAAYASGVTDAVGWAPFILLAVAMLGFITWEGGLFGFQELHYQFRRFKNVLKSGQHVLMVDVEPEQELQLASITLAHDKLKPAGTGKSPPHWLVVMQEKWQRMMKTLP
ncbi:NAD/FAD-utilizing enzyme [Photobacterium sp. CCB-ST2H9]|uniref:NAD/FAD-utilizing enzyme n=1 Tax=unclassified Photobacterium TaxID=2628852 RepID=UPI0020063083|nr:NAD/FAD-utilizing enzyme [Photobacterium sp. CCB-ST2H9]UTM59711.1 NAD/FAD-utilizing enzyme [Photobacterium sp. CCB-ST2H9]